MSDIQSLLGDMQQIKDKDRRRLSMIQWKKQKRTKDTIQQEELEKLKNKEVDVSLPKLKAKEEVYDEMKNKLKMAWKSPGLVNQEFSQVPTLRGKILNEWEIERIYLAERSYKAPIGFKGLKINSQYQEFGRPVTPKKYKEHLDQFRLQFEDYVQRPTKYGKVHEDILLETIKINNKESFRFNNTVQFKEYGFGSHNAWEAELIRKGIQVTQQSLKKQ